VPDVLLISNEVWDGLTSQEQQWLQEAADESAIYQAELWEESDAESLRAVEAAGVEIIHPDKTIFAERVRPLHEEYRRDPLLGPLMQRIAAFAAESTE
jgi:TRAP-type C4-dicarboxylate transport system substrate-binding protein